MRTRRLATAVIGLLATATLVTATGPSDGSRTPT